MAEIKCIDISAWQGAKFDIARAVREDGIGGVILKIGGGDGAASHPLYKDSQFENYYAQAKKCGIPVGCYFFGNADTVAEAEQESEYWLALMKGKQFEWPVFYDVETKTMMALSKAGLTEIVSAVCEKVEKAGYWVGIYSSTSFYVGEMNDKLLKRYTHWVADWRGKKPALPSGAATQVWQTGLVKLASGQSVDGDICYVDNYPQMIKERGLNGWNTPEPAPVIPEEEPEAPTTKPTSKTNEEIAREVILGKWSNGDERKKLLTDAGYDYAAVQQIVNKLMTPAKKTVDEVAREVIQGKWGVGAKRKKLLTEAGYDYATVQKRVNELLK